jgi:hypothetical protein
VPLAQFLAAQPEGVAGKAALDSVQATTRLYWPLFWDQVDVIQPMITAQQQELLPFVRNILGVTKEQRRNSQWQFGYPVPLVHNKPRVGGDATGPNRISIGAGG